MGDGRMTEIWEGKPMDPKLHRDSTAHACLKYLVGHMCTTTPWKL